MENQKCPGDKIIRIRYVPWSFPSIPPNQLPAQTHTHRVFEIIRWTIVSPCRRCSKLISRWPFAWCFKLNVCLGLPKNCLQDWTNRSTKITTWTRTTNKEWIFLLYLVLFRTFLPPTIMVRSLPLSPSNFLLKHGWLTLLMKVFTLLTPKALLKRGQRHRQA